MTRVRCAPLLSVYDGHHYLDSDIEGLSRRNRLSGDRVLAAEGVKSGRRRLAAEGALDGASNRARPIPKAVIVDGIQGGQNPHFFEQSVLWTNVRRRGIEGLTLENVDHGLRNRGVGQSRDQVV